MLPAFLFAFWRGLNSEWWAFYLVSFPFLYPMAILIRHWERGRSDRK